MKNIVIFSGTTEGRLLAESFAVAEIPVTVCVATEYGEEVMEPDPYITVHRGRMDAGQMSRFLRTHDADVVYDATHPYAVEVSQNIRQACDSEKITYKRIERQTPAESHDGYKVTHVKSTAEAVKILESAAGSIFLTTGSKELHDFISLRDRLYVRVLPSAQAIGICDDCGIEKSHIIAQQGPFTYEENLALLRRYDIGILVTKNSGKNGGYDEKIRAAETAGIPVITIDKPLAAAPAHTGKRMISIIGAGCGEKTLTLEAAEAIRQADLIIGSKRLLEYDIVKKNNCPKYNAYMPLYIRNIIDDEKKDRVAVLFSGDSGFYSGAEKCRESLPDGYEVEVIPGISSISAMSSAFHIPYDRAVIRSYHGRQIDNEEVSDTVRKYKNSYYLLSGREDVIKIGQIIKNTGIDARIHIGCDIGGDNESFATADPDRMEENLPQGHLYTICVSGKEDA